MVGIAQSPEITEMAVGEGIIISQRASRYRLFIHCHSNSEEKSVLTTASWKFTLAKHRINIPLLSNLIPATQTIRERKPFYIEMVKVVAMMNCKWHAIARLDGLQSDSTQMNHRNGVLWKRLCEQQLGNAGQLGNYMTDRCLLPLRGDEVCAI